MASNDPKPVEDELPDTGPVAFLTRIVRTPMTNAQTPLRIACLIVLACVLAATPAPWAAVGAVALVVLALSLGSIIPIK